MSRRPDKNHFHKTKEKTMLQLNNTIISGKRQAWRNSYEIQQAAFEHEKRRFQMMDGDAGAARPVSPNRLAGLWALLNAPLQLLAALIG
jgi:hypothetical protein